MLLVSLGVDGTRSIRASDWLNVFLLNISNQLSLEINRINRAVFIYLFIYLSQNDKHCINKHKF